MASINESDAPYTVVATPVEDDKGVTGGTSQVPVEYQRNLPEARDLHWNDTFFEQEDSLNSDGVVAVFDFDYEQMIDFRTKISFASQLSAVACAASYATFCSPLFGGAAVVGVYALTLSPCLTRKQVEWQSYANHVAITRDGIRFVVDKRKDCWGFSMCDKGKHSKTVPYDKITDCDIVEPAGNSCLCIPNVLMTVNVDTASSGGEGKIHELQLAGLKDPHKFKALVWAMKRSRDQRGPAGSYHAPTPVAMEMTDRGDAKASTDNTEAGGVAGILKDIRDELRQNNELLRSMQQAGQTPPASSEALANVASETIAAVEHQDGSREIV